MGILIVITMATRSVLVHTGAITRTSAHVLIFTRADALLLGNVGAILVRDHAHYSDLYSLGVFAVTAIAILACHSARWSLMSNPMVDGGYTLLAVMYLSFVLLAATQRGSCVARLCRIAPLRQLGNLAYPLYLIHQPVQIGLHYLTRQQRPRHADLTDVAISATALVISVGLAALVALLRVENDRNRPETDLRRRRPRTDQFSVRLSLSPQWRVSPNTLGLRNLVSTSAF